MADNIHTISNFVCRPQRDEIRNNATLKAKFENIATIIESMPKTYEQDGKGDNAIAYLHYSLGDDHAFITEIDVLPRQLQAFGYVSIERGYHAGLQYIDLHQLFSIGYVLDLEFEPTNLGVIKSYRSNLPVYLEALSSAGFLMEKAPFSPLATKWENNAIRDVIRATENKLGVPYFNPPTFKPYPIVLSTEISQN